MLQNYLIIHKSILPEYYEKVLEAKRLLESGKVREVSEAARKAGISRSTFYKYRDFVMEPSQVAIGRKAVLSMVLCHEKGVLSAALNRLSTYQTSILTITQSLPINQQASVTVSLDISELGCPVSEVLSSLEAMDGVEQVRLIALE